MLADGEGFEPPDELPRQRFSRPSHSTALPTIQNFFRDRSFKLAVLVMRKLMFALTSLRSQDRRIRPLCQPSEFVTVN